MNIEDGVDFDKVHADEFACFRNKLAGEMYFSLAQTSGDGCADAWRVLRVERIEIEREK